VFNRSSRTNFVMLLARSAATVPETTSCYAENGSANSIEELLPRDVKA
jgi:hypothetical protein